MPSTVVNVDSLRTFTQRRCSICCSRIRGLLLARLAGWSHRLLLPAIAAPMTSVSTPDLVIAACRNGVIGAFPTHNAPSPSVLHEWLVRMRDELGPTHAPVAPNLVVHPSNPRRDADRACLLRP